MYLHKNIQDYKNGTIYLVAQESCKVTLWNNYSKY